MISFLLLLAAVQDGIPRFREQVADPGVGECYSVGIADINGDGKPDIIVATEKPDSVVWYENPSWKRRTMVAGNPKLPVCLQPLDVDGDGKPEIILGADWGPGNRKSGGTVWLLQRPDDLEKPWTPIKIDEEPTMHRLRVIDTEGKGRKELVCSPLHGREGKATTLYILKRPADPFKEKWTREIINDEMNIEHNCWPVDWDGDGKEEILLAALEGVFVLKRGADGKWTKQEISKGDPEKKGAGEIKNGRLKGGRFIATIEPWHGDKAVVYTQGADKEGPWNRQVLFQNPKDGHAVWSADLTGAGVDSVLIGFRGGSRIVCAFHPLDAAGDKWQKQILDDKGMDCEDATCADLNGDGRIDVVAVGRATRNVKIYWNDGK